MNPREAFKMDEPNQGEVMPVSGDNNGRQLEYGESGDATHLTPQQIKKLTDDKFDQLFI